MTCEEVLEWLAAHANPEFREGMVRFGIDARLAVGVRVVDLRRLALKIGRNHALALELYRRPVHEGRILASMIADPALFRPEEMDAWVAEFRSWDLCDQCCINLFRYTSYAYGKVREYAASDEEFTRRAGFALLATLAVGDKRASDDDFRAFLPLIERGAEDSRVRIGKAVNWALRQIGKRSRGLYPDALALAPGKLVRVARCLLSRDAHRFEQFMHAIFAFLRRFAQVMHVPLAERLWKEKGFPQRKSPKQMLSLGEG